MKLLFIIVSLFHIMVWIYIVFAFLSRKTAHYNVYYIIPFLYLLHILPFHILTDIKQKMYPNDYNERFNFIKKFTVVASMHEKLIKYFEKATFNPVSPQGMMIFGAVTSAIALTKNYDIGQFVVKKVFKN